MKIRTILNGREISPDELQKTVDPGKLREMLNSGQPPMSNTDREFLEGRTDNAEQLRLGMFAERYKKQAAVAGVDVKGKVYCSGLAAYAGDPVAWVGSRGDVARVCEERNFGCEGAVSAKVDNSRPEANLLPDAQS